MALVAGRWFMTLDMRDSGNNKFSKRFELVNVADYADAQTIGQAIRTSWANVSGLAIKSYHIYQEYVDDAFAYPVGIEGENQAEFLFSIVDEPTKFASVRVPGAKEEIFIATSGPNRNVIDPNDAGVLIWIAQVIGGDMAVSDGEIAEAFVSGKRVHIASRKG